MLLYRPRGPFRCCFSILTFHLLNTTIPRARANLRRGGAIRIEQKHVVAATFRRRAPEQHPERDQGLRERQPDWRGQRVLQS
jgi:hypothetical protein